MAHVRQEVALQPVHFVQLHVQLGELIDFGVQVRVHVPQLVLGVGQVPQHAVKGGGQFFKLVAGRDLGPQFRVAAADFLAHVAQMLQRLDHHVANDDVQEHHRQEHRQDADGGQQRAALLDRRLGFLVGNDDLDDAKRKLALVHRTISDGKRIDAFESQVAAGTAFLPVNRLVIVNLAIRGDRSEMIDGQDLGGRSRRRRAGSHRFRSQFGVRCRRIQLGLVGSRLHLGLQLFLQLQHDLLFLRVVRVGPPGARRVLQGQHAPFVSLRLQVSC